MQVVFYDGTRIIGTGTMDPYSVDWNLLLWPDVGPSGCAALLGELRPRSDRALLPGPLTRQ